MKVLIGIYEYIKHRILCSVWQNPEVKHEARLSDNNKWEAYNFSYLFGDVVS